jgi:hypothetical protein
MERTYSKVFDSYIQITPNQTSSLAAGLVDFTPKSSDFINGKEGSWLWLDLRIQNII